MKLVLSFLTVLFSISYAYPQGGFILSGNVKDKRGEPLPGTGVYVSGYKIATATDNNGAYKLLLKPGSYDILIQLIGYKAINKNIVIADKPVKLDITLEENPTQLADVTIKPDPNRAYYVAMFKAYFIGTTPNALKCKVVNPDVLIIDYDKDAQKLTVKTNEFLIIENQALGSRIKYLISLFEWSSKTKIIYYEGYPHYEDLNGSKSKKRNWAKKRLESYLGSPQHFFKALYNRIATEEGFIINKLITKPNPDKPADSIIKANIKRLAANQISLTGRLSIGQPDSLSYWLKKKNLPDGISILNRAPIVQDTLVKTVNAFIKKINFTDKLYVIYTKETESPSFSNQIGQSISRPLDMPNYQISTLTMQLAPVYFYENGGIYNPRSTLYSGYWAWEKIADSVPMDYLPDKSDDK